MLTINQQLEKMNEKARRIEVTDDDLEGWRSHKVTQRFLLEVQHEQLSVIDQDSFDGPGEDVGRTALRAVYVKATREVLDTILEWEPDSFNE